VPAAAFALGVPAAAVPGAVAQAEGLGVGVLVAAPVAVAVEATVLVSPDEPVQASVEAAAAVEWPKVAVEVDLLATGCVWMDAVGAAGVAVEAVEMDVGLLLHIAAVPGEVVRATPAAGADADAQLAAVASWNADIVGIVVAAVAAAVAAEAGYLPPADGLQSADKLLGVVGSRFDE
jgi:hypothetical protein